MTIAPNNPLMHGGVPPSGASAHTHSIQPSHEVAGHATQSISGTTPQAETKFLPLHVFNHYVMNLMANSVPRRTSLQERRVRSSKEAAGPDKARRGSETSVDDAVVPVAGRARTAGVSLTLNLLRDPGGNEQHGRMGTEGRARKPRPQPHLYMKTAEKGSKADLSPEDGKEPGQTKLAPAKLQELIKETFPTWGELRQAMQNPKRLDEEIDPKKLEKLKTVTSRELRMGSIREHTTISGFVSELTGLGITVFFNRLVGPENCEEALIVSRRMSESVY